MKRTSNLTTGLAVSVAVGIAMSVYAQRIVDYGQRKAYANHSVGCAAFRVSDINDQSSQPVGVSFDEIRKSESRSTRTPAPRAAADSSSTAAIYSTVDGLIELDANRSTSKPAARGGEDELRPKSSNDPNAGSRGLNARKPLRETKTTARLAGHCSRHPAGSDRRKRADRPVAP